MSYQLSSWQGGGCSRQNNCANSKQCSFPNSPRSFLWKRNGLGPPAFLPDLLSLLTQMIQRAIRNSCEAFQLDTQDVAQAARFYQDRDKAQTWPRQPSWSPIHSLPVDSRFHPTLNTPPRGSSAAISLKSCYHVSTPIEVPFATKALTYWWMDKLHFEPRNQSTVKTSIYREIEAFQDFFGAKRTKHAPTREAATRVLQCRVLRDEIRIPASPRRAEGLRAEEPNPKTRKVIPYLSHQQAAFGEKAALELIDLKGKLTPHPCLLGPPVERIE